MTSFFRYKNAPGATAFDIDLVTAIRLGEIPGFTSLAEHLAVGSSSVIIDDPDANVGHSGDAILGHQRFEWTETAASSNNQLVYLGFTGDRMYRRGDSSRPSLVLGSSREIETSLFDLNAIPSFRIIPKSDLDAKRDPETVSQRLNWILGSDYLSGLLANNGLVATSTQKMDKADYRGQRPVNVIGDCELEAGFNAFVYPDETKTVIPSLWFDDPNTSTTYASTLRISNVVTDVDTQTNATYTTGTTYAPSKDATLTRSPTDVGSGLYLPWAKDAEYVTRAATAAIYGYRDVSAPDSNVKTKTAALRRARRMLREHATEEDRIAFEVQLPAARVTAIRAGHRLQVKFQHLPGYTSFTWTRVVKCTVLERNRTDDRYTLQLEVVPQESPSTACVWPLTESQTFYPLPNYIPEWAVYPFAVSDGVVFYLRPGIFWPVVPTPGHLGVWHFEQLNAGGVGGPGTIDYAGDCVQNRLRFVLVGNGTLTIQTEIYAGSVRPMSGSWGTSPNPFQHSLGVFPSGSSVVVNITGADEANCVSLVELTDGPGSPCGGKWGWSQAVWVAS